MTSGPSVYRVEFDANRYAALDTVDPDGLDRLNRFVSPEPLADGWEPLRLKVVKELPVTPPLSDYADLLGALILSYRAAETLGDLLRPCGEFLPVVIEHESLDLQNTGEFVAFHLMRHSDSLDVENSQFGYFPDGTVQKITRYQFRVDRLKRETMFRLPIKPRMRVYATERVAERARRAALTGCVFVTLLAEDG